MIAWASVTRLELVLGVRFPLQSSPAPPAVIAAASNIMVFADFVMAIVPSLVRLGEAHQDSRARLTLPSLPLPAA
jgi:hypothetical protein